MYLKHNKFPVRYKLSFAEYHCLYPISFLYENYYLNFFPKLDTNNTFPVGPVSSCQSSMLRWS